MHTKFVHLALGMAAFTAPLAGQADSTRPAPDSGRVRVLSHTFTTPSREFVRVRLEAGVSYRAELEAKEVTLEVRSLNEGDPAPPLREVPSGDAQQDGAVYQIEPRVTADYEIRVLGAGGKKIRLTIDRRTSKN